MRFTCSIVECFSRKPNRCAGILLCLLKYGIIRVRRHFSKSFNRHESKLIGLYEEVSMWSFPDFGIIMMLDFFHLFGKQPSFVIALNSWHLLPTAHSGSSISIFGVVRSQPGDFLGCSCSLIIFITLHNRNTIGSAIGKSSSVCDLILRTFVAGFGWNTFLRWAANVSALSLSLRAQQPAGVLIGVTVTVTIKSGSFWGH